MLKLGLRGKMISVIISLLILSFAVVALASYVEVKNIITKQSNAQLSIKTDYMREKVTSFFSKRQIILENETKYVAIILEKTTDSTNASILEKQNIKTQLMSLGTSLKNEYGIIDIYVGYPDGSIDCGSGWVPENPNWKVTDRSWYRAAVEAKGKMVYTDVYIDVNTKKPVVTLSQAIKKNSEGEYGVVAIDIGLSQLAELFSQEKIGETGYPYLVNKDGRFLIHPKHNFNEDISKADTIFNVSEGSLKEIGKKMLSENSGIIKGKLNGETKVYYSQPVKGTNFYIVSSLTEEEFTKNLDRLIMSISIILIGSILFFSLFIFAFIGRITNVIHYIVEGMKQMATGNLGYNIKKINRKDELGILLKSMDTMQQSIKGIIQAIVVETDNVNKALIISDKHILELTSNLEEASATVEELSAGMEETAASTEEINISATEFGAAVETIADKAQEGAVSASEISKKAIVLKDSSMALQEDANETRLSIKKVMDEALEKAKEVDRIKELSEVIMQISSQTNLLALNAAIESARAGEAGKGFSVVSEEIRKLAETSNKTVKEIQNTINIVFEAVNNLADASKRTLDYIETKVVKNYQESLLVGENYDKDAVYVNGLVTELSATSEELLASIRTVSEAINEISKANTEGAEGTNNIAEKVSKIRDKANEVEVEINHVKESADSLKGLVSKFRM